MIDLLALPLFQRALIVGIILGALLAFLGVLVVLRRLAFFSDAIGHSALTGIAAGLLLGVNPFLAGLIFAVLVAAIIVLARSYTKMHLDTVLGVSFPAAVALGVLLVQLFPGYQTDLIAYLFGDILTVTYSDIFISAVLLLLVAGLAIGAGKALVTIAVDESLAHAEGIPVLRYELLFLVVLAAVIAMAIKLVGIVLVTAMLVIPAAAAQNVARSLTAMFSISLLISMVATTVGMVLSALLAAPSGPTIVLTAAACFVITLMLKPLLAAA